MRTFGSRLFWVSLLCSSAILASCGGGSSSNNGSNSGNSGSSGGGENPTPAISSVSPTSVTAGAQNQTVTITGTNFVTGSYVNWSSGGGQPQNLGGTLVSSTELQISLSAPSTGGVYQLTVTNPAPGGGTSSAINFTVVGFATNTATLNMARALQTATLLPTGDVLVAGGDGTDCTANPNNPTPAPGGGGCGNATTSAELYTASTGSFTLIHAMNVARTQHTATLLPNGNVLIAGGSGESEPDTCGSGAVVSAEVYNPTSQLFSLTGNMTTPRMCATATLLPSGEVLIVGGSDGGGYDGAESLGTAELYDPAAGVFTATGSLNTARRNHTATLLPNGEVLIVGGVNDSGTTPQTWSVQTLSTAELYNPTTGTFAVTTENLITARYNHTATLLPNGMVLIAGGDTVNSVATTAAAELFDPAQGTFTSTGNLVTARASQTATFLANGQVLLAGGTENPVVVMMNSAELYDPVAGTFSSTGSLAAALLDQRTTMLPSLQPLVIGGFSNVSNGGQVTASETFFPPPAQTPLLPTAVAVSPSPVTAGNVVVVQGSNFLPNFTVLLDSAPVTTIYLDQTLLGFTVPAGASSGSHTVAVSDPTGGTSTTVSLTVQ